jgi:RND family efflux transporter MFP subunit
MKKAKLPILISAVVIVLVALWYFSGEAETEVNLSTKAFVGDFRDEVVSSGELMAKNSENITAPTGMQRYGLYQIKIANLVDEGTFVEEGDFVAALDKTDISSKINEAMVDLDKAGSQYTQTQLDTALTLREKRNELENIAFQIKQKEIEVEQSVYEPPATIQKMKLDLEKLRDDLDRKKDDYSIKEKQSRAKMIEAGAELQQTRNKLEKLQDLEKEFTIRAPKKGMVNYYRDWDGKRQTGSTIQPWDPTVATLPDLSEMLSKTYINEVDIRKVKVGQQVLLGLDAFPEAQLHGTVTSVANMGENRKGADTKVFEVEIDVQETDSLYRPGMTTSNKVVIQELKSKLQIPLEAVFGEDSISFVYLKSGVSLNKKQVQLGAANDEFVVVEAGLKEGDEVLLTAPDNADAYTLEPLAEKRLTGSK